MNRRRRACLLAFYLVVTILFASCASPSAGPTPPATAPVPTAAPARSPAPSPTPSPAPSLTPTETPTPTATTVPATPTATRPAYTRTPRPATSAPTPRLPTYQGTLDDKDYWVRTTPSIVWCGDPASTTTIEVHITGRNDVTQVELGDLNRNVIPLYDDGTHGDAAAGDNVFTLSGFQPPCLLTAARLVPEPVYFNDAMDWTVRVYATLKNGKTLQSYGGFEMGEVAPRLKGVFQTKDLGNGLVATRYAFFILDTAHQVYSGYPVYQMGATPPIVSAAQKLYQVLPDAFDFVVVEPGEFLHEPNGPGAEAYPLPSNVKYIGSSMTTPLRSIAAKRLKNLISHRCCDVGGLTHEIAHTWGAYLDPSLGLRMPNGAPHWGELNDIDGELGGGRDFKDMGNGGWQYRQSLDEPYAPLELYLMGLIPPEQVPPIHLLANLNTANLNWVTAQVAGTVTIQDIIKVEGGVRDPGVATSQKDFALALVITQDQPYSDADYAFHSVIGYWLMTHNPPPFAGFQGPPFYWATGGRATLDSRLPVDLPDPVVPGS